MSEKWLIFMLFKDVIKLKSSKISILLNRVWIEFTLGPEYIKPWLQSVPCVKLWKLKQLNWESFKEINRILNKKVKFPASDPLISLEAMRGKLLIRL
jgi:hypothetical protein